MSSPDNMKRYTYADYCTWDDGERWELIEGIPFDVRLSADEEDDTVCQPDLLVVCDPSKLDGKCIRHDCIVKTRLYQKAGVREYWILDPETKTVQAYSLQNGQYILRGYTDEDIAEMEVLTGCEIALKDVFKE